MRSFQDKAVLVTGASSGIGEAAVAQLRHAGATVFGLVRRTDALEASKASHPDVRWLLGDVTRPDDCSAAMQVVLDQVGRLDVLVNNAGIFVYGSLENISEQSIRNHFETNVLGLIFMTQAALPALTASRGSIINVSSAAGHKAVPGNSIYGATKAAVESLTTSWALELAPKGIRVNAVSPGPTESAGFAKMTARDREETVAQVPLGRKASADEVAHWIVAIADPGSTWMTGENLRIDGGMSLI
ncbi:MAG: SDR family oxidoreductase [Kofleriaceae bacterium]|nr:SDR family oxidoreductase [Kofleriaceae bacterium]